MLTSFYVVGNYSFNKYLLIRLITIVLYIPFFVYLKGYKKVYMFIVFVLMVFFEAMVVKIEQDSYYSKAIITSRFILYSLLIFSIIKRLSFKVVNFIPVIISVFIGGLNSYLLFELINSVEIGRLNVYHKSITIATSIVLVLACISAANYNFNKLSLKSIFFLIFVYCLSFSDITSFSGFYLNYNVLYYSERLLAIAGYYSFIRYIS